MGQPPAAGKVPPGPPQHPAVPPSPFPPHGSSIFGNVAPRGGVAATKRLQQGQGGARGEPPGRAQSDPVHRGPAAIALFFRSSVTSFTQEVRREGRGTRGGDGSRAPLGWRGLGGGMYMGRG